MYKRDFAILIVSAFAIYFTIQHEGEFTFPKSLVWLSSQHANAKNIVPVMI